MEIRPNISCSPNSGSASATLMRNITKTWLRTKMKSLVFLLKWPQAEKFKLFWREQRPKDTNLPGLSRLNWHVQAVTVQPCQGNKLLIWSLESRFSNQSVRHGFELFYLNNIDGRCYRWVWVLECWKFFPGLLTYVSNWGWRQFLIWGHFILRPFPLILL